MIRWGWEFHKNCTILRASSSRKHSSTYLQTSLSSVTQCDFYHWEKFSHTFMPWIPLCFSPWLPNIFSWWYLLLCRRRSSSKVEQKHNFGMCYYERMVEREQQLWMTSWRCISLAFYSFFHCFVNKRNKNTKINRRRCKRKKSCKL